MRYLSNKRYAIATLCVVVVTLVIDHLFVPPTYTEATTSAPEVPLSPQLDKAPAKLALSPSLHVMSNITLPEPPRVDIAKTSSKRNIIGHAQNPAPSNANAASSVTAILEVDVPLLPNSQEKGALSKAQTSSSDIQHTLNTLTELGGAQLQLKFPQSQGEGQKILRYMHACVGIDIGALKDESLIRLSEHVVQHSPLLRLVSGIQTPKEIALSGAYAQGLPLVRIYPYWFDKTLGQNIIQTIGNTPLTQLSGEYALRGQALWLTHITINHQTNKKDWRLANVQLCQA